MGFRKLIGFQATSLKILNTFTIDENKWKCLKIKWHDIPETGHLISASSTVPYFPKYSGKFTKENILDFIFIVEKYLLLVLFLEPTEIKGVATDMRYFRRIKFSWSLVQKKNFGLIWLVAFKLEYLLCQGKGYPTFLFE